jgi:hypothetical protein
MQDPMEAGLIDATVSLPATLSTARIATMLTDQYLAALTMLREAIEKCPDELWDRPSDTNKTWQIAYHALYFVHLYSQPRLDDFVPWAGQHGSTQNDDAIPGPPDPSSALALIPKPYSREEVLRYWQFCWEYIEGAVASLDLASESSGFHWYSISKLEHQMLNLRHMQLHTGQIMERVRNAGGEGVRWRGSGRPRA